MPSTDNKSTLTPIMIDPDRALVLHAWINAFLMVGPMIQGEMTRRGIWDVSEAMIEEIDQKYHEFGLCKDPKCEWKPKNATRK